MSNRPWSKLKSVVINLWVPGLKLDIHQAVYRMQSNFGSTNLPRYFLTLNKVIIFDYPKDFPDHGEYPYPYDGEVSKISQLLREYVDTPTQELMTKDFKDSWNITHILKAADRRLGEPTLDSWSKTLPPTSPVHKILAARRALKNDR